MAQGSGSRNLYNHRRLISMGTRRTNGLDDVVILFKRLDDSILDPDLCVQIKGKLFPQS